MTGQQHRLTTSPSSSPLLALPAELVYAILSLVDGVALANLSQTCRHLQRYADDDHRLWRPLVQSNAPDVRLTTPSPWATYKELYAAFHPCWFIPRQKIWFADTPQTGQLILTRYNPGQACIEGYRLLAERIEQYPRAWEVNPTVLIHPFRPLVKLWFQDPVLRLDAPVFGNGVGRLQREVRMDTGHSAQGIHSMFMLVPRPWLQEPSMALWPPPTLPARERVRNDNSRFFSHGTAHLPRTLDQTSDTAFRIRKWMQFTGTGQVGDRRIGEDVATFCTLPEECYTATKDKPWQGIWVGDYSGHGCEFLLIRQVTDAHRAPISSPSSTSLWHSATVDDLETAFHGDGNGPAHRLDEDEENWGTDSEGATDGGEEAGVGDDLEENWGTDVEGTTDGGEEADVEEDPGCTGRLEAIKLTGDPNVPRGEISWYAEDIGRKGLVRIADEPSFEGARIVRSQGHVAERLFQDGKGRQGGGTLCGSRD